ncbi:hypothetical protein CAOG_02541 [Capsaspora owczarzaki ATCC 30864]|uniref:GRIP domain-containing protein n=1 Tax=Capsaspora owczarzaki (strain ATCC 30864) TaxID=595528 RepID=A0A0D2X1U2_CAPO3|nr:hypothetical protein CAOG_02541 [Capsaspora owczarzaki ATCC 30864]KJE91404.1 hypothetical protein CAOG_002541 [Capsaspora owczarzaki ATCC 30864]|eukprot:XP_004349291.1 hypothetical protein CAOG_02541 [Capsaspora owczarzaki ATCC 30864]
MASWLSSAVSSVTSNTANLRETLKLPDNLNAFRDQADPATSSSSSSSSISSISHYARDVLVEGTEETVDLEAEVAVLRQRLRDAEATSESMRQELNQRIAHADELTQRAESTDLQLMAVSREYKELLMAKEAELNDAQDNRIATENAMRAQQQAYQIQVTQLHETVDHLQHEIVRVSGGGGAAVAEAIPTTITRIASVPTLTPSSIALSAAAAAAAAQSSANTSMLDEVDIDDASDFGAAAASRRQIEALNAQLLTARRDLDHWKRVADENTSQQSPATANNGPPALQDELAAAQTQIKRLRTECLERERQMQDMEQVHLLKIQEAQRFAHQELELERSRVADLQAQLDEAGGSDSQPDHSGKISSETTANDVAAATELARQLDECKAQLARQQEETSKTQQVLAQLSESQEAEMLALADSFKQREKQLAIASDEKHQQAINALHAELLAAKLAATSTVDATNEETREQIQQLQSQLQALQTDAQHAHEQEQRATTEAAELRQQLEAAKLAALTGTRDAADQLLALQQQVQSQQTAIAEAQQREQQAQSESTGLRAQLEAAQLSAASAAQSRSQEASSQISELQQQVLDLQAKVQGAHQREQAAQLEQQTQSTGNQELSMQIVELQRQVQDLQAKVQGAHQREQAAQQTQSTEMAQLRQQLEASHAALDHAKQAFQAEQATWVQHEQDLKSQVLSKSADQDTVALSRVHELENALSQLTAELNKAKLHATQADADTARLVDKLRVEQERSISLDTQVTALQTDLQRAQQSQHELFGKLQQAEAQRTDSSSRVQQILDEHMSAGMEMEAQLKSKLASLEQLHAQSTHDLGAARHEIELLQNEIAKGEKTTARLRQHLLEIEDTHTTEGVVRETRIAELEAQIAELSERSQVQANEGESAQLDLAQRLQKSDQQVAQLAQERDALQTAQVQLRQELEQTNTALSNMQLVLDQMTRDSQSTESLKLDKAMRDLAAAHRELAAAESKIQELERALPMLQQYESQVIQLRGAQSLADQQLLGARNQIADLNRLLKESHERLRQALTATTSNAIDKGLVKNLIVSYFKTNKKNEVLNLIGNLLEFDDAEKAAVGIGRGNVWSRIGGIASKLTTTIGAKPAGVAAGEHGETLSDLFVQFLLEHSNPAPASSGASATSDTTAAPAVAESNSA